jgi:hypothetical protein
VRHIAEFVAVLACSLFTGGAGVLKLGRTSRKNRMRSGDSGDRVSAQLSSSDCDSGEPSSGVSPVFHRAWLAGTSFLWVVAGVLLGSVIPFTLIVILPTNKQGALRSGGWHEMQNRSPQWFDFRPTENASTRQMC